MLQLAGKHGLELPSDSKPLPFLIGDQDSVFFSDFGSQVIKDEILVLQIPKYGYFIFI